MKYMLMMHAPRGKGDWQVPDWPPQALKAHIDFMMNLNHDLTQAGELVGAEGLAGPDQARVVRAKKDGAPEVTDGPFAEAKEFLAGSSTATASTASTRSPDGPRLHLARMASRWASRSRCGRL